MDAALEVVVPGAVVLLPGRLTVAEAADVRLVLAAQVEAGTEELVLDLARVQALDATGLGVLVGAHRRAQRAGRTVVLRDVPAPVRRLLHLTRLDRVLRLRSTAHAD